MKKRVNRLYLLFVMLLSITGYRAQHLLEALEVKVNIVSSHVPFSDRNPGSCPEIVPDKYYGDGIHDFVYCVVQGPNNKKWLNLNLGAEWANIRSRDFSPMGYSGYDRPNFDRVDWNERSRAYDVKGQGSLFQAGRDADGHEIVKYSGGPAGGEPYYYVTRLNERVSLNEYLDAIGNSQYGEKVSKRYKGRYIAFPGPLDGGDVNDWNGEMNNNPCPKGFQIMGLDDILAFLKDGEYQTIGGYSQPTLVKNKKFPWLILHLGVVGLWDEEGEGEQKTNTYPTDNYAAINHYGGNGATAGLWIRDLGQGQILPQEHTTVTYDKVLVKDHYMMVDRGVYMKNKEYPFGIVSVADEYMTYPSLPIRCVSK